MKMDLSTTVLSILLFLSFVNNEGNIVNLVVCPKPKPSGSQPPGFCFPRRRLLVSGDFLGCHKSGRGAPGI